jgi:hypothetical protein
METLAGLTLMDFNTGRIKDLLLFGSKYLFKRKRRQIITKEQFIESVYHLCFYGKILNHLNYTISPFASEFKENQIKIIAFSIQWNILIITQSVIDELNKYLFNYNSNDIGLKNRIRSFRKIITPALNEIKKWKDIKEFRNNILAHNGRDYNGDSAILSTKFNNYCIPKFHADFLILFKLLQIISEKAEEIFSEEKKEADKIMDSMIKQKLGSSSKNEDFSTAVNRINNIISEMNKRAEKYCSIS